MTVHLRDQLELSGFKVISDFTGARDAASPRDRLEEVRRRAAAFRERFLDEPVLPYYASFDLLRVPYPREFAYGGVYSQSFGPARLVQILNRLFVIQYHDFNGTQRVLLFSPSDYTGSHTPYFKRMEDAVPAWAARILAPYYNTVERALDEIGLSPADVDYISYDHLHTQNLRRWLGTSEQPAFFPKAKLIVHKQEWASTCGLLPNQGDWYSTEGISGVSLEKVVMFNESLALGPGLAFLHSPGHTYGNHSLVTRVPDGIRVTSENGVAADSWAPLKSKYKAIRDYARQTGSEVILNSNTLESSVDQYISMVMEATVAGPAANPDFLNTSPSSEASPHWLFPGSGATHLFGTARFGTLKQGACAQDPA